VDPVLTSSPTAALKSLGVDHPAGGFIRPYQRELAVVGRAIDLALVTLALRLSMAFSGWGWDERHTLLAAVGCILFYLSAEGFKVYDDRRSIPLRFDLRNLLSAWAVTAFGILFLAYALKVSDRFSRVGIVTWFLLTPSLLCVWQLVLRAALTKVRSLGYNMRRVAIVGASEQGMRLARAMAGAPWMGLRLVGVFDDRTPAEGRVPADLPAKLLGKTDDLLQEVARRRIDMVYVTLPINNTERIAKLVTALSDTTISLYFVPDMFLFSVLNGRWVRIGDLPAVSVFETPFYGVGEWMKRVEDLVLSTLILLVTAVPMAVIALAIRLESPGAAIFKQRRYGLDGTEFWMWKFRTMKTCDDEREILQATRDDPRVTRVGRFLRRTSLDELPQFVNVLAGSMSVVGPRPHATAHNEYYRHLVRHYMVRHKVRPGITGWAQVNGLRGETDTIDKMEARVDFDLWYIRNWSILLDLKVVARTIAGAWRDRNAY
jgi:putative colanic acid biosynthesis UDP-glucose lipid carrier transferase